MAIVVHLSLMESRVAQQRNAIVAARPGRQSLPGQGGCERSGSPKKSPPGVKSGTHRVGFAHFPVQGIVVLVTVRSKNERANLSPSDRTAVARVQKEIEWLLEDEEAMSWGKAANPGPVAEPPVGLLEEGKL